MITVDADSAVPPFEQIRSQIAAQILSGERPVGSRLPTVRGLAAEVGVAVNTVARAFTELEQAGLVQTRGRAGTIVGAGGDAAREKALQAAREFAAVAKSLGLDVEEAVGMVKAALADG